ncbi:MAG: hypothetical protein PHR96_00050 [Clostridia bacterium]|nr:hypothetical protein [Clostridia bacterium]
MLNKESILKKLRRSRKIAESDLAICLGLAPSISHGRLHGKRPPASPVN